MYTDTDLFKIFILQWDQQRFCIKIKKIFLKTEKDAKKTFKSLTSNNSKKYV